MIHIDRGLATEPPDLASAGKEALKEIEKRVAAGTLDSKCFDNGIYSSSAVREALWAMQHQKCCFCEREYERKWSTAEHFRPKTEADRGDGGIDTPGYWWLAFQFRNLYFCCQNCNSPKGSHFPLEKKSRKLAHPELPWPDSEASVQNGPLEPEQPILIDPGFDQPEDHLTFVELPGGEWEIAPLNLSERGRETIRRVQLDRDDLNKLRAKHFKNRIKPVLSDFEMATANSNQLAMDQARQRAKAMAATEEPFALLARAIFRSKGLI